MTRRVADVIVENPVRRWSKAMLWCAGRHIELRNRCHSPKRHTMGACPARGGGAFAAGADALLTGELAMCAGSCGPGSLHFINGVWESNRNRAPVVLIASQIVQDELGFEFPQEVDFKSVYAKGTVFCEEIRTPARKPSE